MSDIQIGSVWRPLPRPIGNGGPARFNIYVSHWNRANPQLLVAFTVRPDGIAGGARHDIHPNVLLKSYERADG